LTNYPNARVLTRRALTKHYRRADRVCAPIVCCERPVATRVAEVSTEHSADLVVLSWSQDSSPGRARAVREVLGASALPVLLLPVEPSDVDDPVVLG
jgi:hypothetical protein